MSIANDILSRVDESTKESVNYKIVTNWYDSTLMDDSKCDGYIYRKKGDVFYKLVFNENDYVDAELIGIVKNNNTDDAKTSNATLLKNAVKQNLKVSFKKGTFYFNEILIDFPCEFIYLKSFSEFLPSASGSDPQSAIINTEGGNFILARKKRTQLKVIISNIAFKSVNFTGSCFESLPKVNGSNDEPDTDLILISNNVIFDSFNKAFYTDSFSTICQVNNTIFSNNNFGFYSEKASNMSRFKQIKIYGNKIGIYAGGFNCKISEVEVSLKFVGTLEPNEKTYGIVAKSAIQIDDLYHEEYGGTGVNANNYVLKLIYGNFDPEIRGFYLNNVRFVSSLASSHLELQGFGDFFPANIFINTYNEDGFLPERITSDKEYKSFVVNGKNMAVKNNTVLFNKNEVYIRDPFQYNSDLASLTIDGITFHRMRIDKTKWEYYDDIQNENVFFQFGGVIIQNGKNYLNYQISINTINANDTYNIILATESTAIRIGTVRAENNKGVVSGNIAIEEIDSYKWYFIGLEPIGSAVVDSTMVNNSKGFVHFKPF